MKLDGDLLEILREFIQGIVVRAVFFPLKINNIHLTPSFSKNY